MTTPEIIVTIAGTLGLAEVIKLVVERIFGKKRENINTRKDEFAALRERLDYNEKVINTLTRQLGVNTRKIARMSTTIAEMVMQTCSKTGCKMREIIDIDFGSFDDEFEAEDKENTTENTIQNNDNA